MNVRRRKQLAELQGEARSFVARGWNSTSGRSWLSPSASEHALDQIALNKADHSSNPTRKRKRREAEQAQTRKLLAAEQRLALARVKASMKAEPGPCPRLADALFVSIGERLITTETDRESNISAAR